LYSYFYCTMWDNIHCCFTGPQITDAWKLLYQTTWQLSTVIKCNLERRWSNMKLFWSCYKVCIKYEHNITSEIQTFKCCYKTKIFFSMLHTMIWCKIIRKINPIELTSHIFNYGLEDCYFKFYCIQVTWDRRKTQVSYMFVICDCAMHNIILTA
jgi:hypothetical protein